MSSGLPLAGCALASSFGVTARGAVGTAVAGSATVLGRSLLTWSTPSVGDSDGLSALTAVPASLSAVTLSAFGPVGTLFALIVGTDGNETLFGGSPGRAAAGWALQTCDVGTAGRLKFRTLKDGTAGAT